MKKTIILICLLIPMSAILAGCGNSSADGKTYYFDEQGNMSTTKPAAVKAEAADKLEIYYFHRTARCYSCNALSQMTTDLVNGRYSRQIQDGRIDFRELNVELPENREIAAKFKASGSSLFINRIIDGQDNIEQDVNVWRQLGSKANFDKYLGDKLDSYLGL